MSCVMYESDSCVLIYGSVFSLVKPPGRNSIFLSLHHIRLVYTEEQNGKFSADPENSSLPAC
jgi:hypothetical protein